MSVPVSNNNVPSGGVPGGQGVGGPGGPQEQTWWRADIRTFVMNLWVLIAVVLYAEHYIPDVIDTAGGVGHAH